MLIDKNMKKLVIFDCDGVLVDSEHLANKAFVDCLAEIQITITVEEAIRRFKGRKMADCFSDVESSEKCKLPSAFEADLRERMNGYFETHLKAVSGAESAVKSVTVAKCVASNGPLQKTKRNLEITKLSTYFGEDVFSAYTIQKWKPDPDLFLHACKMMGSTPDHCIVVEDSDSGIQAALAGGFKVLAFGAEHTSSGNVTSFQSMLELPSLVDSFFKYD